MIFFGWRKKVGKSNINNGNKEGNFQSMFRFSNNQIQPKNNNFASEN